MSQSYYIKTELSFDFNLLQRVVERSLENVAHEQRAENLCYFWVHGASTRGVDVTLENENFIEIRNTSMSNLADYALANQIVESICNLFTGILLGENSEYDEDENDEEHALSLIPIERPLYNDAEQNRATLHDATLIRTLISSQQQTIALFGPVRKVHFGSKIIEGYKDLNDVELFNAMEALIIKVNYSLPDYDYGNILQTGEGENIKILKLLTNEVDCIIDKYDYILFNKNRELIAITNDTLNSLLPKQWELLDEYTIVAPIVPQTDFDRLVENAEKVNQMDELKKIVG